ncbi:DUF3079 domain-containing protein [Pseudoduganella plicata]|uniref:DUF3079 domain-containing protein n=1 Tax=Pseudoduganella plicata TaxID=321984 RepID=A0ABX5S7U1_9BURK|nr:DUF3079 domain-containing protein [Pseudoduganella plicata]
MPGCDKCRPVDGPACGNGSVRTQDPRGAVRRGSGGADFDVRGEGKPK